MESLQALGRPPGASSLTDTAETPIRAACGRSSNHGLPRSSPRAFASLEAATTIPSLLLNTTNGISARRGLNTRSNDAQAEFTSTCASMAG